MYLVRKKDTGEYFAMKILRKDELIEKNLMEKTTAERDILQQADCPYVVRLHYAFQTDTKLYFIIDYLNGGELFTYLRSTDRFDEKRVQIYAAELVIAISYLHSNGIVYRDLKPENVLLDDKGHIKITDFGLSKLNLDSNAKTFSFCGTPEYIAPEIIMGKGHSFEVDWWSLGALMYEMLTGRPPFYNKKDKQKMLRDIVDKQVPIESKEYLSDNAKSILTLLLERDREKRIGGFKREDQVDDAEDIKQHPFFETINWKLVAKRQHLAPFKPKVTGALDTSNIDTVFTDEPLQETFVDPNQMISKLNQQ